MRMLGDHMPVCEVRRYARQFAEQPPIRGMKYALALVRHFLSQYRENSHRASAIPNVRKAPRTGIPGGRTCSQQERWSVSSPQRITTKRDPFTKASWDSNLYASINLR